MGLCSTCTPVPIGYKADVVLWWYVCVIRLVMSATTSLPTGFLVIMDIAEFTSGKFLVKGSLFVHLFADEKIIKPRQNIKTICVKFCRDYGTIVLLVAKNSQVNDI